MRPRGMLLALVLLSSTMVGCADQGTGPAANPIEPCGELAQGFEPDEEHNPRLLMETTNGTMTIVVYGHQVPFTASHVRQLVEDETWEETRFHYLFPGEAILGGDPRSKSEDRQAWGSGGYHYNVADDHHAFLRHDEAGVVSLLSPQPNRGGSQFVVTLGPQPGFDDQNSVFGEVIEGMDTAHALARTPTDDRARPQLGAYIENVTWIAPPDQDPEPPEISAYGYDCLETAEPNGTAEYLVAVRNTGQAILNGSLETSVDDEEGWSVELRNADASRFAVPSGQTVAYGVNVTVPEDAETGRDRSVELRFTGQAQGVEETLTLTTRVGQLGEPARDQEEVELRYVGVLEDGRVFDATEPVYAEDESLTWFSPRPSEPEPVTLEPTPETLSASQPGQLVQRARLGETVVGFVAPEDAYGSQAYGDNGLGGRLLLFQVHVTAP